MTKFSVFLLFAILGTVIVHCQAFVEKEEAIEAGAGAAEVLSVVGQFAYASDSEHHVRAPATTKKPVRASTSRKPIAAKSTTGRGKPVTTRRPSTFKPTSKKGTTTRRPTTGKGPGKVSSPKPRPPVQSTLKPPSKLVTGTGNSVQFVWNLLLNLTNNSR